MPLIHVFDLGKVLVDYDFSLFERRLAAACRQGAPVMEVVGRHLDRIRPEIGGDFDSVHPLLVRDLELAMTMEELRLAWNDIFTPIPGMAELVAETPRPRYLLSTINEPHATWIRERFGHILELFDHCFLSNEIGLAKPDMALFRHVERETGVEPGRLLFVDDLAENVMAARAAGWRVIQFTGVEECRRQIAQAAAEDATESTSK